MLKNYLKIAFRNLKRQTGYSALNIVGLAVGLAVCLVIGLYVREELGYDRFHGDADRIYRVVQEEAEGPSLVWSGPQMGLRLEQDFAQIETVLRVIDGAHGYGTSATISRQTDGGGPVERFEEDDFLFADPGFFTFFSFPLLAGDPETVLDAPGQVVVTESTAEKYFGDEDPVGQTLVLDNEHTLEVVGVAADPPANSHLTFRFVASYATFYAKEGIGGELNSFWWPPTHTYVKLQTPAAAGGLRAALPAFMERHRDADDAARMTLRLQPLTEIWLGPSYRGQQQAGGSMAYVYLFSAIALFILLLSCINFVNLATARAAERAKEVGVRKTVGAARRQLVVQFLIETVLLSAAALGLAVVLAELMMPVFNDMAGRTLSIPYQHGAFWGVLLGLVAVTALMAGAYPAFYLSRFRPAVVVQGALDQWTRGAGLRKSLVVFQFTISVVLLVGTTVVYQQLRYVQHARLGFDAEHVVVLPGSGLGGSEDAAGERDAPRYEALRAELLRQAPVRAVTAASDRPGMATGSIYVWEAEGKPDDVNRQFPVQLVGDSFFEMMDLEMVAGRPLRADDPTDIGTARRRTEQDPPTDILENRALVINETAARRLGWTPQEALGKRLRFYITENDVIYQDYRGAVVGVVEDHHTASLHEPIEPVAYMPSRSAQGHYLGLQHVLVKLAPGNASEALHTIEATWEQLVPAQPFSATFLDESLDALYRAEARMGTLIGVFAFVAVLIACLGLFGLAAYTAEQRSKEVGVRKVLGASVQHIIVLLSKDFLRLVLVAFALAVPIAYLAMNRWLENFAYRIDIGPGLVLAVGGGVVLVTVATVSTQAVKAALTDPVHSLRHE